PANFDIRPQDHRIVPLHEWIQQLMYMNRSILTKPPGEIVPLKQSRHGVMTTQTDHLRWRHCLHPFRVETNFRPLRIKNFERLTGIRVSIRLDLFTGERLPRLRSAGRVANHAGEVANQKDDRMPKLLKLAQFSENDGVPEVQIRS